MKFLITAKYAAEEREGNARVFMTGAPNFININDTLNHRLLRPGVVTYRTGLKEADYDMNPELTPKQKEDYKKILKRMLPKINEVYTSEVLDPENKFFWDEERTKLKITTETLTTIFDTDDVDSAILYLNILCGGFPSVAPSKEVAERTSGYTYYITTEDEAIERDLTDQFGNKAEAYDLLTDLLLESGNDALIYISYLLTDLTKGYTKNTKRSTIKRDFINYIENGVNGKNKKKSIDNFYKLAQEWQNDKEGLILKAIINAAIYHGIIRKNSDKRFEYEGVDLGNTTNAVYQNLNKPVNASMLEQLVDVVEAKLNK